jgi:hypothetical protein
LAQSNASSGGFFQRLGNFVHGNGWKTDAEVKQVGQSTQGSPKTPLLAAGRGLPPEANGPAQAAKSQAKNFMKSPKPDPPLRGVPEEAPNLRWRDELREIAKNALDEAAGGLAGVVSGATEIVLQPPVPGILLPHDRPRESDEGNP